MLALVLFILSAAPLPGAEPFSPELSARLLGAAAKQPQSAKAAPKYTNRLILESSPYLQQHAHNPVNWFPWGDEAFEVARRENKPVLLSVGYSTCHWCHVMERESFEDEEIAAYLNRNYVAIKVDREQRPDIDGVYMTAVQMMSGGGGWPMTVWLTVERKPFYGGTYYPPRDGVRLGRPGFLTLLQKIGQAYAAKPEQVAAAAQDIAARLEAAAAAGAPPSSFDRQAAMASAAGSYRQSFDREHGGFGSAPKFPRPSVLLFLLRHARRTGAASERDMVAQTLAAMNAGGIHDHLGGGFHRYSTDERWRVPHFEKMLYDNAQLTIAYLEGFQATGDEQFAATAREILAYVEREMSAPDGGFYSASDADSSGVEGAFFVWTPADVTAVLGAERAAWFSVLYGVTAEGDLDGKNVLHLAAAPTNVAKGLGVTPEQFDAMNAAAKKALYAARAKRVAPSVDRKVVVSWNALMISAFARAAFVLGEPQYGERAARGANFILEHLDRGGRLQRSAIDGRGEGSGYLDDYAFLIQALLDLFEAGGEVKWLQRAIVLQRTLEAHFWDAPQGGYFLTADDAEKLLTREKPDSDGAEPAGNSVAALNLARLAELTGDDEYGRRAEQILSAFGATLSGEPTALPAMLAALDFLEGAPKEIAIVKPSPEADAGPLLAVLRRTFLPNHVLVVTSSGAPLETVAAAVPWVRGKGALEGEPTAYVCEKFRCDLPTASPQVFASQLERKGASTPSP